ncbi:LOW QUALITY PROTEIN: IQ motif-containing protein H [Chanos chanos]|uniref:LOW QUALITY PROTEIN: IQ motif-containing protein H n=1 Tax=Chanos chanos TaxID=29144 RepID=A0A6J2UM80_CHACN|nr:LOW QUALITY PROTEIN: IQ domain-containing protein H [Chanos chanos]
MTDNIRSEDNLSHVLVKVQDDLKRLRRDVDRITAQRNGETLDLQALNAAISRTEDTIRKRAEEYLKIVNRQMLMLPPIEDVEKKTVKIPKWKPSTEALLEIHPEKHQKVLISPGEKHKAAFTMRLLYNPTHPLNRDLMHQRYGIELPEPPKRAGTNVSSPCVISLMDKAFPSSTAYLRLTPVQSKAAYLHQREDIIVNKTGVLKPDKRQKEVSWGKSVEQVHGRTPALGASKASNDKTLLIQGTSQLTPVTPETALVPYTGKYSFIIKDGRIDPAAEDYCCFKQHYCLCWDGLVEVLRQIQRLLRDFAVPLAWVCGERLVSLVQSGQFGWTGFGSRARYGSVELLLSVLENREEVWKLLRQPGRRYKGEGGVEAAAIRIQACWRRYYTRAAYLAQRRRKWAAGTIAISWLLHTQLCRVRKSLQVSRYRHLENFRRRTEHLAANWKHISSSRRTIIHIPSLGYPQHQRFGLSGFDILQNTQMGRLCEVRDENVEVIYVCPVQLTEDVLQYYKRLLVMAEDANASTPQVSCAERFTVLTPEARAYFPLHNMCLSTLLKYSPRTLQRIRLQITGKQAYIVSGVAHIDDLAIADELGVPVLGPEPGIAQLYSTKSRARRIFASAGVDVPPGQWDICMKEQLYDSLAQLMADHMEVKRWLFKMDSEMRGWGMAYVDVSNLSCHSWAQQEFIRHEQEHWRNSWVQVRIWQSFLDEVPYLLFHHAKLLRTSRYRTWDCFMQDFLKQGGVIEAYPPSDSVTGLAVDLLVEPDGEVKMLSCSDQLYGPRELETIGCSMPQTSVCPETLYSICIRVGQACRQRRILGYLSLDLVTFLDPNTLEQQVWVVDLDLGYSNQLAMTQLMLMMTGGTLDCRSSRLEVPIQRAAVRSRYAVIGSRLLHSNISMMYHSVFFQICKARCIAFDIKERLGTVFALHDSKERYSLGMITISEDLQEALLTFARNLSFIHQEISSPNMQGKTNFKDVIKAIEGVLSVIKQNETIAEKEEEKIA